MKRKRPEHGKSINYIRHIKHAATFLLIAVILFTTAASASAYLNKASKIKVEVARAHVVSGKIIDIDQDKIHITIRDFTSKTVEIQPQTVILWNGSLSSWADLKPGMLARAEFDKIEPSKLMRLKISD